MYKFIYKLHITIQGRPQDLGGGGQEFFFEILKFACREAQWRNEGNWRPGVKLNLRPPPSKIFFKMILKCI